MLRTLGAIVLAIAFLAGSAAHAAVDPAVACRNSKAKATGKKASDVLKALGKNVKKPNGTKLAADISKAESKFTKAFTKAEAKAAGQCATSGDSGTIEDKVNALVVEVLGSMPPECGNNFQNPGEECDGTDDDACPGGCQVDCLCPPPPCNCCSVNPALVSFTTIEGEGTCGKARNFRCIGTDPDFQNHACVAVEHGGDHTDCDFGPCLLGPNICVNDSTLTCTSDAQCQGACTEIIAGSIPQDLVCGGLYTGGGQNSVRLPLTVPDEGVLFTKVTDCTNDILTLGPAKGTDLVGTVPGCTSGSEEACRRTCSEGKKCSAGSSNPGETCVVDDECPGGVCEDRCLFGPPLPVPNEQTVPTSVCVINVAARDASGSTDCSDGSASMDIPLAAVVFLHGDLLSSADPPNVPGIQACPLCTKVCQGGDKAGFPCENDSPDCDAGGTCSASTQCLGPNTPNHGLSCTPATSKLDVHDCCDGGTNNGARCNACSKSGEPCTDDSDCVTLPGDVCLTCIGGACISGCTSFPTSHDCPPNPAVDITEAIRGLPIDFSLTTGMVAKQAFDLPEATRTFCGFCRDLLVEGSECFDGFSDPGGVKNCPESVALAGLCSVSKTTCTDDTDCPASETCKHCLAGTGLIDGCGTAIPCTDDSDCTAPYESCAQRNPGFASKGGLTYMEEIGTTDGECMADLQPHVTDQVSVFCIPPTHDQTVDSAGDLPGAGATALRGNAQVHQGSPSGAFIGVPSGALD
jgi:hypothetical protein